MFIEYMGPSFMQDPGVDMRPYTLVTFIQRLQGVINEDFHHSCIMYPYLCYLCSSKYMLYVWTIHH